MFRRTAVLAGLVSLLARPAHAQATIYNALGGEVTFQTIGFSGQSSPGVYIPFQIFLEAVNGQPRRELFNESGTSFTLGGGPSTPNGTLPGGTPSPLLSLGFFPTGADLIFSFVTEGGTTNQVYLFTDQGTKYSGQYFSGDGTSSAGHHYAVFFVDGIESIGGGGCLAANYPPGLFCTDTPFVPSISSTPEPGTIALMATGLVGLVPIVRRKRRRAA